MEKAKLFWSGRSQAVKLPKGYRFAGNEVNIRRFGNGVLLEPIADKVNAVSNWIWLDAFSEPLDEEFQESALEKQGEQPRPDLDQLFNK